ncbi:ABC transporter permease [Mesorhizobium sp. B2-3-2]|nr:ABC transporter permease [Mesorhizobium sp. B2-3-2]
MAGHEAEAVDPRRTNLRRRHQCQARYARACAPHGRRRRRRAAHFFGTRRTPGFVRSHSGDGARADYAQHRSRGRRDKTSRVAAGRGGQTSQCARPGSCSMKPSPMPSHANAMNFFRDHITYVIFLAITLYFVLFAPHFASVSTASAVLRITAIVSAMAIGMTFVIICGEIDLSVGSVASFSGMIGALLLGQDVPTYVAALLVLAAGAAIGATSGILVTKIRIPSFLVTLGMLSIFSGLALTITGTRPVSIVDDDFSNLFWNGSFLGVQAPIWWTIVLTAVGYYLLHQMPFGRRVYATGGNPVAARFSGVRTDSVKIFAFVLSGMMASLAGMMLAARSTAGNPSLGAGLELDVIAAVIIGGTSLFGGYGSIVGSVVGAIFIGILGFGLLVLGLSTSIQEVIKGAIIIIAVSLNRR